MHAKVLMHCHLLLESFFEVRSDRFDVDINLETKGQPGLEAHQPETCG
jgi:hypothetical protein